MIHTRPEPNASGWTAFETFRYAEAHPLAGRGWFWSDINEADDHVGFTYGPFPTEAAAAANALAQGYAESQDA